MTAEETPETYNEADLPQGVSRIYEEITDEQLIKEERATRAQDDSYVIRTTVKLWAQQQSDERKLRRFVAKFVCILMAVEIGLGVICFLIVAAKIVDTEQWVATVFFGAVFTQVAATFALVVRYLFQPNQSGDHLAQIVHHRFPT